MGKGEDGFGEGLTQDQHARAGSLKLLRPSHSCVSRSQFSLQGGRFLKAQRGTVLPGLTSSSLAAGIDCSVAWSNTLFCHHTEGPHTGNYGARGAGY
jgi:hypothetical protein